MNLYVGQKVRVIKPDWEDRHGQTGDIWTVTSVTTHSYFFKTSVSSNGRLDKRLAPEFVAPLGHMFYEPVLLP